MSLHPLPWQTRVWSHFQHAQQREQMAHAYLLVGPSGVGKYHLTWAMTAARLCETPNDSRVNGFACGHCRACRWLESGFHPDLWLPSFSTDHAVETARKGPEVRFNITGSLNVDAVRQLTHFLTQTPQVGRQKLAILPNVEQLLPAAANALLKTLEEPPPNTILWLTTAALSRVLATVQSRCQRMMCAAPPLTHELTQSWLRDGCPERDPVALLQVSEGAPLAALFLAPQWDERQRFFASLQALLNQESDLFSFAEQWGKSAHPIVEWLLMWCEDALRYQLAARTKPHPFCVKPIDAWWTLRAALLALRANLSRSVNVPLHLAALLVPFLCSGDAHV